MATMVGSRPVPVPEPFAASERQFFIRTEMERSAPAKPKAGNGARPSPLRASTSPTGPPAQLQNYAASPDTNGRPSTSNSTASTVMSRDSYDSRTTRSPSAASSHSSFTSFDSLDLSSHAPRLGGSSRPTLTKQYRRKSPPGELFSALPGEVLELILDRLRKLHLAPNSVSCATCMMRDFCAVALSSRKWLEFARVALYEDIQLVGNDSPVQKKRYKIPHSSRLVLLRRTLRSNDQIAAIVRNLKVPTTPPGVALGDYQNVIASVIMACPNLEKLGGAPPEYDHNFSKLFHSLHTRRNLKEMNWVVKPSPFQRQRRIGAPVAVGDLTGRSECGAPGDLQPEQSTTFFELNMNWTRLTTLSIHCLPGATLTPVSLISSVLECMPALHSLSLSGLPYTSFNDNNLMSLPALKSLSLSHLSGVTSSGLSSFATLSSSRSIKSLTLKHLNLESLPALARMLANLGSLETFAFVQSTSPTLPDGEMIWLYPYVASPSLRKLHWDITSYMQCAKSTDSILAKSIEAKGFPSLRTLRAPNDSEGLFQALCAPAESIEKVTDKYRDRGLAAKTTSQRASKARGASSRNAKDEGQETPGGEAFRESSDLHGARRAAQFRLEEARRVPRFFVNVIDDDGTMTEKYGMAGYMGDQRSKIRYCLTPDAGAADENGGLADLADLVGEAGQEDLATRDGCTGRWNANFGSTTDKKDLLRWSHVERGRWRGAGMG